MDESNPKPNTDQGNSDDKSGINPVEDQGKGSTKKPDADPQAEAYRKKQSENDKSKSRMEELEEDVNFFKSVAMDQVKDKLVKEFMTESSEKYPNVTAEDLSRFANSPDELEDIAKYLQKKHDDIKQSTLASVREVPEESMTEDAKTKALENLQPSNRSFGEFLRIKSMKTRK